jgi:hypothetical protein
MLGYRAAAFEMCSWPPKKKTHRSIRSMSGHAGTSANSVRRIAARKDLKLHRVKTFTLSYDPKFEENF